MLVSGVTSGAPSGLPALLGERLLPVVRLILRGVPPPLDSGLPRLTVNVAANFPTEWMPPQLAARSASALVELPHHGLETMAWRGALIRVVRIHQTVSGSTGITRIMLGHRSGRQSP
jgi:hypothetical protein